MLRPLPHFMSSTKRCHLDMVLEDVTELYVGLLDWITRSKVLANLDLSSVITAGLILNCPKFYSTATIFAW